MESDNWEINFLADIIEKFNNEVQILDNCLTPLSYSLCALACIKDAEKILSMISFIEIEIEEDGIELLYVIHDLLKEECKIKLPKDFYHVDELPF